MISRSVLVPITFTACFSFCTSPQTLVTVPIFSYAEAAGRTRSALLRGFGQEQILHDDERFCATRSLLFQRIRADHPEHVQIWRGQHLLHELMPPSLRDIETPMSNAPREFE